MNKLFKKASALVLAGAITLSSSVMASAATMNVYIREWTQTNTDVPYVGTVSVPDGINNPVVVVKNITSSDTYKSALIKAASKGLATQWNGEYLTTVTFGDYSKTNDGKNENINKDDKDNVIGAIWKGDSWMWYPGSNLNYSVQKYPETTLGATTVPDVDEFSIVLSYDHSEFAWGTPAEN